MKVSKLTKGLAALRDASKANGKTVMGIELPVDSDAKAIAKFATFLNYHRSNCLRETVENGELWRMVN